MMTLIIIITIVCFCSLEIPNAPRNLSYHDTNADEVCSGGPRIQFKWQLPNNTYNTVLTHYEYSLNNQSIGKRSIERELTTYYSHNYFPIYWDKIYYFEVYAVDMCGRKSEPAQTIYMYESYQTTSWWPWP